MTQTGVEYGTALFEIACENDEKELFSEAIKTCGEIFADNPGYKAFLASPGIPMGERLMALDTAFAGSIPEDLLCFLKLLTEKGRVYELDGAFEEFHSLYKASEHISNVTVSSAVPLTEDQKTRLIARLEKLSGNKIVMKCVIEEKLLGGITITTEDRIVDGSLKKRLREIKDVMTG